MIKMCFSFLLILTLINFQVEAKTSCNDDCLTKTYCISDDGSSVCSKNNLVTAQFKVIPVFGEYDYLEITLKGHNVAPYDEKKIKLSFDRPNLTPYEYICDRSFSGATNATTNREASQVNSNFTGSSYYVDGVLYCIWIVNFESLFWPEFASFKADMIQDSSQSITLHHDSQKVKVAEDTSQLPIYKVQYLKCCNKVHGNDAFVLTFDQIGEQIFYQFYNLHNNNSSMTLMLTRKDEIKLQFDCIFMQVSVVR